MMILFDFKAIIVQTLTLNREALPLKHIHDLRLIPATAVWTDGGYGQGDFCPTLGQQLQAGLWEFDNGNFEPCWHSG